MPRNTCEWKLDLNSQTQRLQRLLRKHKLREENRSLPKRRQRTKRKRIKSNEKPRIIKTKPLSKQNWRRLKRRGEKKAVCCPWTRGSSKGKRMLDKLRERPRRPLQMLSRKLKIDQGSMRLRRTIWRRVQASPWLRQQRKWSTCLKLMVRLRKTFRGIFPQTTRRRKRKWSSRSSSKRGWRNEKRE